MKTEADEPQVHTVAILLATYNGSLYLRELLDSLLAQSFNDFVLYVRDDGSSDDTIDILHEYAHSLKIEVLPTHARLGPAMAFFSLMQNIPVEHDILLFADQDDWWYPDKIERAVAALAPHARHVSLYCTRLEYVNAHLAHLKYSPLPREVSLRNAVVQNIATGCTVAITRATRTQVLEGKPHGLIMHDWWLYIYCAAFGSVIYDPTPSIKYRQHSSNAIGASTTFFDETQRRVRRFLRKDTGVYRISSQVNAFLECYGSRLESDHRRLLQRLLSAKGSITRRVALALQPGVVRQSRLDSFILRVLFLLGRY